MPKRLLITGFDPFGGQSVNPAWEAVSRLPARVGDCVVHALQVPTVFGLAAQRVIEEAQALRPDVILCVGQAGGTPAVRVERVAINLADARIPDNDGAQPLDEPLRADGDAAYFSTLPVRAMVQAVRAAGLPCSVSYTAGTYVCNAALYNALYLATKRFPGLRAGFVHVPYLPAQVADKDALTPCMPLPAIVQSLTAALQAAIAGVEISDPAAGTLQ